MRTHNLNPFLKGQLGRVAFFSEGGEGAETGEDGGVGTIPPSAGGGFYDGLSDDTRNNPSMMKFKGKSGEDVAKSYIELSSKIGAKGLIVPGENASEQEVSDYHKALGRPDLAAGYNLQLPEGAHKGVISTPEGQKEFKEECFKNGLSAKQAEGLYGWYTNKLSNTLTQNDEKQTADKNTAETELRSKWGMVYDNKVALAQNVLSKFGGDKMQSLIDSGVGNNPVLIEMLANIGDKLSEDVLGPNGKSSTGALTPEAAQAKINEIRNNPNSPYNAGDHPMHKEAVEEMTALYRQLGA